MKDGIWSAIERLNEDIQNINELRKAAEKRFQEVQNWKDIPIDYQDEMEQKWLATLKHFDDMIAYDLAIKEKFVEQVSSKN